MEHLSLEALARLVDETPFRSERRHLARCRSCARELELLSEQTEALKSLPDLRPAPGNWPALEARLRQEGLLRPSVATSVGRRFSGRRRGWMQGAAALLFFITGTFTGIGLTSSGAEPDTAGRSGAAPEEPATVEQAAEHVRLAEQQYYDAMLHYRELTREVETAPGPRHFAALETLVAASQAAVQQAPDDPYLNGFLVSAIAEREAVGSFFASADRY